MKKISKKIKSLVILFIAVTILCIYSYGKNQESILTSVLAVSGTKIEWGIKRSENHEQPELRESKYEFNGTV
mgnify:FL=1